MRLTLHTIAAAGLLALLACACWPVRALAANWAVIVAGSSGYDNYRHQADACHAYQIVRENGVPQENIITFMYNDIAHNPINPFPGQIFNRPTAAGVPGTDVYAGVQIDYAGDDVSPENFLAVLRGNSSGVHPKGGKVLNSMATDRILIYFADHGGPGFIELATAYLFAPDLLATLEYMHVHHRFGQMVFYLEACESGSMFDKLLKPEWNIYALTASNPEESSWGAYCQPADMVNGKELHTCLGDLMSVSWMEDSDARGPKETLAQQAAIVRARTNRSHVMQYGDMGFLNEPTGDFLGMGEEIMGKKLRWVLPHGQAEGKAVAAASAPMETEEEQARLRESSAVSSRDIPLHSAYWRYLRAPVRSVQSRQALKALRAQLDARERAEDRFEQLSLLLVASSAALGAPLRDAPDLFAPVSAPLDLESFPCVRAGVEALKLAKCGYDDFSMQFHRVLVHFCTAAAATSQPDLAARSLVNAIEKVCAREQQHRQTVSLQ